MPAAQMRQTEAPAAEYQPAAQLAQAEATLAPTAEENLPAGQGRHCIASDAYVPAAQKVQTEAPLAEYLPAAQLAQVEATLAPTADDHRPGTEATCLAWTQVWSTDTQESNDSRYGAGRARRTV